MIQDKQCPFCDVVLFSNNTVYIANHYVCDSCYKNKIQSSVSQLVERLITEGKHDVQKEV